MCDISVTVLVIFDINPIDNSSLVPFFVRFFKAYPRIQDISLILSDQNVDSLWPFSFVALVVESTK